MEGSMNRYYPYMGFARALGIALCLALPAPGMAQEGQVDASDVGRATIRLRKSVQTRDYDGQAVQGEERQIVRGDTLWRILINEKGLSGEHFRRYVILLGSLNPQLKDPDILSVGDILFIPVRPDKVLGIEDAIAGQGSQFYRVKRGDYLFKILREQRGFSGIREIFRAFDQVKQLNPRKKNWDLIYVGEAILLPPTKEGGAPTLALRPGSVPVGLDYGLKLPVNEHLDLLQEVTGVVGSEVSRQGEEQLLLREGTVHIDRSLFPVIQNAQSGKKVVLNLEEKITPTLQEELQSQNPDLSIVAVKTDSSLHEAADSVFLKMGYESLPADRPVVVQDEGVAVQVKGEWMLANQDKNKAGQEMWIISLADASAKTPEYLKEYLSLKGMNFKEIVIPSAAPAAGKETVSTVPADEGSGKPGEIENWPRDKQELVDAFLKTYDISYASGEKLSFPLRHGMRVNTTVDRLFDVNGGKIGVFFTPVGDDVKQALREKKSIRSVELELSALSSRQILGILLATLGEGVDYQKLRFPVFKDSTEDKLVLTVSGFFLPKHSMLLTDQTIPKELQRFFFDKGLRVAYFR